MRPFLKQYLLDEPPDEDERGDPLPPPLDDDPPSVGELLVRASGAYCAFCEIPLGASGRVVDKVSTSAAARTYTAGGATFQWYTGIVQARNAWSNQILSCPSCAAWRGDYPGVQQGLDVLAASDPASYAAIVAAMYANTVTRDQARVLYRAAESALPWPDASLDKDGVPLSVGGDTAAMLTCEASSQTPRQLAERRLVRLDDSLGGWADQPVDAVWIVPNPDWMAGRTADEQERVYRLILAPNLNYCNIGNPFGGDRRVVARRAAYGSAQHTWQLVTKVVQSFAPKLHPEVLLEHRALRVFYRQLRAQVRDTGFWSMWDFALRRALVQPPWSLAPEESRRILYFSLLVQHDPDTGSPDDEPQMVLPGTDLTRLPL